MADYKDAITAEDLLRYYNHNFQCSNCGKLNHKWIKKGVTLNKIFFPCDNCGCGINGRTMADLYKD